MVALAIALPHAELTRFCQKWRILRLAVFGSTLRDDFRPESDVDFLATFADDATWSLLDLVAAEEELTQIVGRPVDLVERSAVEASENWIRRQSILGTAQTVYER